MRYPLEPKDCQTEVFTADGPVHEGPCLLVSLMGTCETTARWIKLRNGTNTSAPVKVQMQPGSKNTAVYAPPVPVYFSQGIYLDVENSIQACTIQFVTLQQGE